MDYEGFTRSMEAAFEDMLGQYLDEKNQEDAN